MADGLDEYELGELVGTGSSAQVYIAHRVSNGQVVAIKVLDKLQHAQIRSQSKSMSQSEEIQEIKIQSRLHHPNILQILDVFEDNRNVFIVVEPCLGGSLQTIHEQSEPLSEAMARQYIRQIAAGISYMQAENILHRDLKLSNILLTEDGVVKIADFGLATDLSTNQAPHTICGTPNFIAPEVILGKPYSFAADLWSLGCITYTLVTGKPPFQGLNVRETLQNIGHHESISFPKNLSPMVIDFMKSLLRLEPSDRLSCSAILLHPWLQSGSGLRTTSKHSTSRSRKLLKASKSSNARRSQEQHSSSSSLSSCSSNDSEDDPDIAQLQSMLDKISGQVSLASPPIVEDDSVDQTKHVNVLPLTPSEARISSFVVEYYGILDASDVKGKFTCSRTSSGVELSGANGEFIEYIASEGFVRGNLSQTCQFEFSFMTPTSFNLQPRVATWIRLAQWCLSKLPVTEKVIEIPKDALDNLARLENLEQSLRHQQSQNLNAHASIQSKSEQRVEIAGIGQAESLEDGTLNVYFTDGTILQVDDCASTVGYLPKEADAFDYFSMATTDQMSIPFEVSRRLKFVPLFISELQQKET